MTLQTLTGALPLPLADGEDEDMWDGLGKVCIYYISLSSWTSAIIKYIYTYTVPCFVFTRFIIQFMSYSRYCWYISKK